MEGNMSSEARHHGGGSQLHPNQGFVKIKAAGENVLSRLRALFRILSSNFFCWELLFLYSMAFMLIHAHGEEQTGICKLMPPAMISSVVNFETIGLCQCSSTEQLRMKWMNMCIPHVHENVGKHSPELFGPPIPSTANVKVMVTVLAISGGIGLAGWILYKRWRAFSEADINRGLMSEPAVPRRSNPTFEILPSIVD